MYYDRTKNKIEHEDQVMNEIEFLHLNFIRHIIYLIKISFICIAKQNLPAVSGKNIILLTYIL